MANRTFASWLAAAWTLAAASSLAQSWQQLPSTANDIGVGANGAAWIIGTDNDGSGNHGIYRFQDGHWHKQPGSAVRIDVDPHGNPWVVNAQGGIYRWTGNGWQQTPGSARGGDIGIGASGAVWLIGGGTEVGGLGIWRWNGSNWDKIPGSAVRIDVDPQGRAWVVTSGNAIFRYDGARFVQMPGAALDIGIGGEGTVWVVGTDQGVYRWDGANWVRGSGGLLHISADGRGHPWGVNAGRQIFAANQPPIAPPPPPTAFQKGYLVAGESMVTGQSLQSPSKSYYAALQSDGNLCVYGGTPQATRPGGALWCHQRTSGGPHVLAMQPDGNLCTYRGTPTQYQANTWCSHAVAAGGQFFVVQQDDGNLCVYRGTGPGDNKGGLWCHNTNVALRPPPAVPEPVQFTPTIDGKIRAVNATWHSMWVTVYHVLVGAAGWTDILHSECVRSGKDTYFDVMLSGSRSHKIQAEMTSTADCSSRPNNSHVICKTDMAVESFQPGYYYFSGTLKGDAGRCWLEGGVTRIVPR